MKNVVYYSMLLFVFLSFSSVNAYIEGITELKNTKNGTLLFIFEDAHKNLPQKFESEMKQQTEVLINFFDNSNGHFILEHAPFPLLTDCTYTPTRIEFVKYFNDYSKMKLDKKQITTCYRTLENMHALATSSQSTQETTPNATSSLTSPISLLHKCQPEEIRTVSCSNHITLECSSAENIFCMLSSRRTKAKINYADPRSPFKLSKENLGTYVNAIKKFDSYMEQSTHYTDSFTDFYKEQRIQYNAWKERVDAIIQKHVPDLINDTQAQFQTAKQITGKKITVNEYNVRNVVTLHDLLECTGIPQKSKDIIKSYENFGVEIEMLHSLNSQAPLSAIVCGGYHATIIKNLLIRSGYSKIAETPNNKVRSPIDVEKFIGQHVNKVCTEKPGTKNSNTLENCPAKTMILKKPALYPGKLLPQAPNLDRF